MGGMASGGTTGSNAALDGTTSSRTDSGTTALSVMASGKTTQSMADEADGKA